MKAVHRKITIIFIIILLLGFLLRIWGITSSDLQNDAALNALRSFAWLDYLPNPGQTSPMIWFGEIPWWGNLSFHDMPPLVMLIQNVFFKIFGANTLGASLPFIFSGVGVLSLLYFLLKKLKSKQVALLGSSFFAISSYAIWSARTGYLEGVAMFFIVLSVFFFLYFLKDNNKKYLFFWGASLGLALVSKYTAIFLLPAVFLYLLIWRRDIFKIKEFWWSFILMLIILSPVIIYNTMMWQTRGHFDAALSSMLGSQPNDFAAIIVNRSSNTNWLYNLGSVFVALYKTSSLSFFIVYILSLVYTLVIVIKKQSNVLTNFLALNILFILLMFSFSGAPVRFLSIIVPFLSLITACFICRIWKLLARKIISRKIFVVILILIFGFELFYAINTNILESPIGRAEATYSPHRFYNRGFNELDKYLQANVINQSQEMVKIRKLEDIGMVDFRNNKAVLFDERLEWFSRFWYLERYLLYNQEPFFYFSDINRAVNSQEEIDILEIFSSLGVKDFWFVYVTDQGTLPDFQTLMPASDQDYKMQIESFKELLENNNAQVIKEIKDYKGEIVFKVYYLKFD